MRGGRVQREAQGGAGREGYTLELNRSLEAARCLERGDLRGANEALEKAYLPGWDNSARIGLPRPEAP